MHMYLFVSLTTIESNSKISQNIVVLEESKETPLPKVFSRSLSQLLEVENMGDSLSLSPLLVILRLTTL